MHYNLDSVLRLAILTPGLNGRRGVPVFFADAPGTGKTSRIGFFARRIRLNLLVIIGSLRDPTEFAMPVLDGKGGIRRVTEAEIAEFAKGPGIVLLDELDGCSIALQKVLLRPLAEGRLGEIQFHPEVRWIGALNPGNTTLGANSIAQPLVNRAMFIDWPGGDDLRKPVEEWTNYMLDVDPFTGALALNGEVAIEAVQEDFDKEFKKAWPEAVSRTTAFIAAQPQRLRCDRKKLAPNKPFASDRSWDLATRVLAASYALDLHAVEQSVVLAGLLGDGLASEFETWLAQANLPDIAAVLEGREHVHFSAVDLSRTYAILSAALTHTLSADPAVRPRFFKLLEDAASVAADAAGITFARATKRNLHLTPQGQVSDEADSVARMLRA